MWLTPDDKKTFKSIVLLHELMEGRQFKISLNGDDKILEPVFIDLAVAGCVEIKGNLHVITDKGKETYQRFMNKYFEYLKVYDVFSLVDLEKGEFAFSKFFDFATDEEWDKYKSDPRFSDLRIAVALFKKINPAEFVFMSFVNEGRFDTQSEGWQKTLIDDSIWNEIEEICKTAYKPEQLGEDAMKDMIEQGSKIMMTLLEEEKKARKEEAVIETTVTEEFIEDDGPDLVYYESYYDPFFVPLFWWDPFFIW